MRLWLSIGVFMCLVIDASIAQLNSGCEALDQCTEQVLKVLSIDDIVLQCREFLNYIPCAQSALRKCSPSSQIVADYRGQVMNFYSAGNCSARLKEITTVPEMSTVSKKSLEEMPTDIPTRQYSTSLPGFTTRRPKHKPEKRVGPKSGHEAVSSSSSASSPTPPTSPSSLTSSTTFPKVADSVQLPDKRTVASKTDEKIQNATAAVRTRIGDISGIAARTTSSLESETTVMPVTTRQTSLESETTVMPVTTRQTSLGSETTVMPVTTRQTSLGSETTVMPVTTRQTSLGSETTVMPISRRQPSHGSETTMMPITRRQTSTLESETPLMPSGVRQTSTVDILESTTSIKPNNPKPNTTRRDVVPGSSTNTTLTTTTTVLQTRNVNSHTSISSILTDIKKRGSVTTSTEEVTSSTTSGYRTSRNMETQSAPLDIDTGDYAVAAHTEDVMFSGGILLRVEWILHTVMLACTILYHCP